ERRTTRLRGRPAWRCRGGGLVARRVRAPARARPRRPDDAAPARGHLGRAEPAPDVSGHDRGHPGPAGRRGVVPLGERFRGAGRARRPRRGGADARGRAAPAGRAYRSWWFTNPRGQRVHGFVTTPPGDGPFPLIMQV